MLVGMASENSKTIHTSVWIAQDTTESRVPRLNVHTNQILARVVFAVFACHSYQHNILEMFFCILFISFFVVALATTVSALVDEGTVR